MSVAESVDLKKYCQTVATRAKSASAQLAVLHGDTKIRWLKRCAELVRSHGSQLQKANEKDLAAASQFGLTPAQIDRLRLTPKVLESIALGLGEVAALRDPIGEVIESTVRPNGLDIQKVRVPLGVVFFIYESRPNVTADAAALCVMSGNAVILRGGKEAIHSNQALAKLLSQGAQETGIPPHAIQLVETTDRQAVEYFLAMSDQIDVAIPRGGEGLIRRVSEEATMPVIKHFAGNCHVYVDASADQNMALAVTLNSKCHRYGVCNAAESLLVHKDIATDFLPKIAEKFKEQGVEIRGDDTTCRIISTAIPATEDDYRDEFLAPIIAVKVVNSLHEAIEHINRYSSKHTETIITSDYPSARAFHAQIDSSAVMVNASTRFNDGGEFGLGAEIGISTDKFHARGPCGLTELTSYKYLVYGNGQVRE